MRARLFDRRVVFVAGRLEAGVAAQAAMEIMTLDGTGDGAISLQLECRDGDLEAALSLMDVVELAGVPVHTTALGLVAGPPVGVVAVSARRLATPNARFGLFEARTAYAGQARDLERWAEHTLERNRLFCARLAAAVGQAPERVEADVERGTYLSAEEARDYGLIDEIVGPLGRITALPGPPMGFGPR
ncbi:MAG TPA: ATP-dependent Clp protease proteolytic subunit [Acidimicrobiales bacterium]|nr:ATP-dependent Clp protease proteolytic subunit [Acidimicrobiales bacterium]